MRCMGVLPSFSPMRLLRIPQPLDHPALIYELKYDGFRGLAYIDGHHAKLVSRNGHTFKHWPSLCGELAHAVRCDDAILDGEIVCLGADGQPRFNSLLFRRGWPYFMAFDLLWLNGEELRLQPLIERKRRLKAIVSRIKSRVRYAAHIENRGTALFEAACRRDFEGIVAKWRDGTYQSGRSTSWMKVKNPTYSQMIDRGELFEARDGHLPSTTPRLVLA